MDIEKIKSHPRYKDLSEEQVEKFLSTKWTSFNAIIKYGFTIGQIKVLCYENNVDFESLKSSTWKKEDVVWELPKEHSEWVKRKANEKICYKHIWKQANKKWGYRYKTFKRLTKDIEFTPYSFKGKNNPAYGKKYNNSRGWIKGKVLLFREWMDFDSKSELDYMIYCIENGATAIEREPLRLKIGENHTYLPDFFITYKDRKELVEVKGTLWKNEDFSEKISALERYCSDKVIEYKWVWDNEYPTTGKRKLSSYQVKFDREDIQEKYYGH